MNIHNNCYKTVLSSNYSVNSDKTKLLKQLKSGFTQTSICNKYQLNVTSETQSQYLNYLIHANFLVANRFFVLTFEDNAVRIGHTGYYLPKKK